MNLRLATIGSAALMGSVFVGLAGTARAESVQVLRPASERYAAADVQEVPDFQRHLLPLMGRLGCNTRACHGSFQGRGGFRLSLFGYDFKMDHEALMKDGSERVDVEAPEVSKIIAKPTLGIPHKGGKRMEEGTWQYAMMVRWIEAGAKSVDPPSHLERLEVIPSEIVFERAGQQVPLKVIAHWADGTQEDVTCITRYRTNDESIAEIDADGLVTCKGKGDSHVVAFYDNGVAPAQVMLPVSEQVGPKYPEIPTPTKIDELVVAKLKKLGIVPAPLCSDAEFLRRVSLDMTGSLPTPSEVEAFLADTAPQKRERKVDELLERPSYAAWWATKFCDLTGDSPRNLAGLVSQNELARNWYAWVYKRIKDNTPYDQFIAGIVLATSRKPGQNFDDFAKEESSFYRDKEPADYACRDTMPYYWMRRNLRKPEEKALGFSYTFLGVRLECAQCHKHPFDQWTQDDFNQFTAFFTGVGFGVAPDARTKYRSMQEELGVNTMKGGDARRELQKLVKEGKTIPWQEVFITKNNRPARKKDAGNQKDGKTGRVVTPKLLGGDEVELASQTDPRAPLMEWLRRKDNPYFARAYVNRVWANYFNVGIVQPADDMNLANPPSNPALLDALVAGFVAHGYDMKWLHREIATSQAYQRGWQANATNELDERNFSRAVIRRLPAEVVLDAVTQATAKSDVLASFANDLETRAIGPQSGAGGTRKGAGDYAARVFGRSSRDTNCDCSRSNEPNLLQSIFLQNDQETLGAIERKDGWLAERTAQAKQAAGAGKLDEIDSQIKKLQERLEKLKKDEENDESAGRVKKLETRLKALREDRSALKKQAAEAAARVAHASADEVETLVSQAFLRTLSRYPTGHERELARTHFQSATTTDKALRDLLWALLNTKEFITNH